MSEAGVRRRSNCDLAMMEDDSDRSGKNMKEFDDEAKGSAAMSQDDKLSMFILLVLYTLQGIPMGLCGSIPLIMKERGVSYEGLSLFSLVTIPFSLKLFWAPLVDSCYFSSIGRRKTWIIPVQIVTGIVMIFAAPLVDQWMGPEGGSGDSGPSVGALTAFFIFLYFLMATQDIAVDGWALTMLSRENVGYASMCNSIGQSFGFFLANQGFIAFSDATWCHRWLGTDPGISLISLAGFMQIGGWVFLVTTLVIAVFKKEKPVDSDEIPEGCYETYKQVVEIFKLRPVQLLTGILLTCRIAFAPADAVSGFKMQEYGMPKADIATISPLLLVIGLVLPALVGHAVSNRPLDVFMIGLPLKIATSLLGWVAVQATAWAYQDGGEPGITFFGPLIAILVLNEIAGGLLFVSLMSFFAKISDPAIGGTYMTLLNTITNLGSKWPDVTALYLLPKLTMSVCRVVAPIAREAVSVAAAVAVAAVRDNLRGQDAPPAAAAQFTIQELSDVTCSGSHGSATCHARGGKCHTQLDGYTVEMGVCMVVGILWIFFFRDTIARLQFTPPLDWMVVTGKNSSSGSSNRDDSNNSLLPRSAIFTIGIGNESDKEHSK